MKTYWNIRYCQLWTTSSATQKVCDLPAESVLLGTDFEEAGMTRVVFRASKDFVGFVRSVYLEEVTRVLPDNVVFIENQTYSMQDAAQYVFTKDGVWFNLCGELCICAIAGVSLETFMRQWQAKPLSLYNRIIQKGLSRTTDIPDLVDMARVFPNAYTFSLAETFNLDGRVLITPNRLQRVMREGWNVIVSVHINYQGKLRPSGTLHWINLVAATPNGINAGWIEYYNPFSNSESACSFDELSASMGNPYGLLVKVAL